MDTTTFDTSTTYGSVNATAYIITSIIVSILLIIAFWKIFAKAGEPGWKSIIPIYNLYIFCKITWGKGWMWILWVIPCVGFVFEIITMIKLAKAFGKGTGFAIGLIFLPNIFTLILGFGDAQYQGVPD